MSAVDLSRLELFPIVLESCDGLSSSLGTICEGPIENCELVSLRFSTPLTARILSEKEIQN